MNTKRKRICIFVPVVLLLFSASTLLFSHDGKGTQTSMIQIGPDYAFHHDGETFNINVYCSPIEPVKSFEFKIEFDQTKLQANSVTEGDFFAGYSTFFSPNILIDNENGTIKNIYDLIVGQGNITTPGTFVTISFTVINGTGISPINIIDLGITNETEYVPCNKLDAAVQVFSDMPPWDVNKDYKTDAMDISFVMANYGATCDPPGSESWDVRADGNCNILDISCLLNHYGETTQNFVPQYDIVHIHH